VTLPASLTLIDADAFFGCQNLVEVYDLSEAITVTKGTMVNGAVGRYALDIYTDATATSKILTDADGYVFHINGGVYNLVAYVGGESALTLPESCNGNDYKIYQYAFRERTDLVSVEIPVGVTAIGKSAFSSCTSLKRVTVAEGSRMTSIGASAFIFCEALESLTLPFVGATADGGENTHLGYLFGAEDYTENRTSVPTSLTSVTVTEAETIKEAAFYGCSSLTRVELSLNVLTVDRYAFYGCTSLKEVVLSRSVTTVAQNAFRDCSALTDVYYGGSKEGWARVKIESGNECLSEANVHLATE
jgi:hypothetical protein